MMKRWIARRRRRLDLYGRMRGVETRLRDFAQAFSGGPDPAERIRRLDDALAAMEHRLAQAEGDFGTLKEQAEAITADHRHELAALQDRLAEVATGAEAAGQDAAAAVQVGDKARSATDALSIRTARLETQRQLDMEEGRKTAAATLQELKRSIIRWRSAEDALTQVDRTLPSRRYVGRPWEDQRPARLRPGLALGLPFLQAGAPDRLHMTALESDGAPSAERLPLDMPDDNWVAFAPIGSLASPAFSRTVLTQIERHPETAVFYADDLAIETEEAIDQIRLKPEFDLTLLAAQDYVGAPLIVRVDALRTLNGLDPARGTAACADLLFRAQALGLQIRRIPEVLLAHPGRRVQATAPDYRAMLQAQASLADYRITAGATLDSFRLERRFTEAQTQPVTLLIPTRRTTVPGTKDSYIERLLASLAATDWPMDRLIVIVGDDVAGEPDWARRPWPFTLRRIETIRGAHEAFNYAAKMNILWRAAETEQIVFMNDDVRAIDGGWLKALQTFALDPGVGGVGARLLCEDGSLQHAGMAPHGAGAAHLWIQRLGSQGTYQNWASVHREWSMVTGAIFATRRALMDRMDGFDERYSLEFNDTDLSLRMREAGYRIVSTPFAQMIHVERASRRQTPPPEAEAALFHERWSAWLANDPSWHPGLDSNRVEVTPTPTSNAWYV